MSHRVALRRLILQTNRCVSRPLRFLRRGSLLASGRKAGSGRHTRGGSRHSQERRSTDWPIAGRAELTPCATSAPPCESILLSDAEPTFSIRRRRDDALLTLPYAPQKIPDGVINARGVSRGYTRIRINRTFKINSGLLSWMKETPRASVRAGTSPSWHSSIRSSSIAINLKIYIIECVFFYFFSESVQKLHFSIASLDETDFI